MQNAETNLEIVLSLQNKRVPLFKYTHKPNTKMSTKQRLMWAFCLLISSGVLAQKTAKANDRVAVLAAQEKLATILTTQNWAALPDCLGDSMLYIHSFGRVDTKTAFLKNIQVFQAIPRWEYKTLMVQLFPKMAIVTSDLLVTLKLKDGTEASSQQHVTEVWQLSKTKWIMVSHQSTTFK
jgi:ketosteroid isomerase-like protein